MRVDQPGGELSILRVNGRTSIMTTSLAALLMSAGLTDQEVAYGAART